MSVKISISAEVNEILESMLLKVNDGFENGKITKQNLCSWLITTFETKFFERKIPSIRSAHVDPIVVLQAQIAALRAKKRL
jgi:hypothetical protein